MNNYVYKDNEATMPTLSARLTSRIGDGSGNHEQAYLDTIKLLVIALGDGSMIDIGCGRGRIAETAAPYINNIVALEPDPGRCNWSREALAQYAHIRVLQQTTGEFIADNPGRQFGLAILGMVLQHLSTWRAKQTLEEVAALTCTGGMAIVSTTHALEQARCFTYQHVSEARVGKEEFNCYAENAQAQDKGLPVHRFSRAELESYVPESFEIAHWQQFSYYRPEFLHEFAVVHQVAPEELADHGNSQFMVLKKR